MNKKRVMIVLPWADEGAAGIEQQMLLFARFVVSDVFSFIFVPIVSNEHVGQLSVSAFGDGVDVRPVISDRSLSAMKRIREMARQESVSLVVAASAHLGTLSILSGWFSNFPRVVTINQGIHVSQWKDRMHAWFSTLFSQVTIGVSPSLSQALLNLPFVGASNVVSISNPFDLSSISTSVADVDRSKKHVVYVGRLEERQKSLFTLLSAFETLDHDGLLLHLVGDGPDMDRYQRWVEDHGLVEHILFHGWQKDPNPFIAASDVLVLPSRYEGFGRVLVEALALGVNVVSTDCPYGPSDILDDGLFGRLVPVGDVQTMGKAIEDTLAHPKDPATLQARAQNYDVRVIAPLFEDLLESLV
ncbi:MAG: glycosyltransferase [bacterium]|jgi:glycosyltransferase involved in cell wall biosynthesis|nr:glycosyltransferase [bacterium]